MASKEWIVFLHFQSFGVILLIFRGGVAGSGSTFFFGFCTLERNYDAGSFLSHGLVLKLYFNIEFPENERQK